MIVSITVFGLSNKKNLLIKQKAILLKGNGKFTGALTKRETPVETQERVREMPAGLGPEARAVPCAVGPAATGLGVKACTVCHRFCVTAVPGNQPLLPLPELLLLPPCFSVSLAPKSKVRTDASD